MESGLFGTVFTENPVEGGRREEAKEGGGGGKGGGGRFVDDV
jgi:hypothetical protein